MEQRRVLVVTQHYWPEQFRINDIVQGFAADGIGVDVLCGLPNYPKGEWYPGYRYTGPRYEEQAGGRADMPPVRIWRAGEVPRRGNSGPMIFFNYVSWPFFALFSLGRPKGPYDAVFCYNTSPVLMALPALVYGRLHRVPVVTYVLDLWPENLYSVLPVKSRFWRGVARRVSDWHYRRADRLIAMSGSLQKRLIERTGKPESAVAVIPQYCEDFYALPQPDAALAARYANGFNLVFTGNFSPAQSLDTVLRALGRARQLGADKQNLRLLLVGDGMSRAALEALADELGLAGSGAVVFCGSVPPAEVPRYTTLADALVVSLNASEDLGLTVPAKLASYMAAAKPILASMDGEGRAAVEAAGCGLASAACDAEALAQNMLTLCRLSAKERAALGQKAFACYQSCYRRAELLRRLEDFLLPGRPQTPAAGKECV